ncbi:hypothetical protein OESDEN_14155 [Oesophagostomum dentatum]|uniref:Uncharacterized protein n=1 Tax=Oesophagostomum dentatum TaxID=61180 RepID=A0A0B1SMF6_OESDE|nr:hypothetical protein OESDEN_14155 [Oesophagostomum dentatum]
MYECFSECVLKDASGCIGKKPSTGRCNSEGLGCPKGSVCIYGMFGPPAAGVCCDSETNGEQYAKEWNPKCDDGKFLFTMLLEDEERWLPFVGKKCSHEFCPDDADCVEGKWLSHCCGSKEKFGLKEV